MVDMAGGYFDLPFKVYHGVTQGDPLSSTIFHVVVYSIIYHWVIVVTAPEEGMEVFELLIHDLVTYFYANNVIVASPQPERMQRAFDVLTGLFDRVRLRTKTQKTVIMDCYPCHTPGRMSVEAHKRRTMGTEPTFWERQRSRVM